MKSIIVTIVLIIMTTLTIGCEYIERSKQAEAKERQIRIEKFRTKRGLDKVCEIRSAGVIVSYQRYLYDRSFMFSYIENINAYSVRIHRIKKLYSGWGGFSGWQIISVNPLKPGAKLSLDLNDYTFNQEFFHIYRIYKEGDVEKDVLIGVISCENAS